jgi:hypothetical protein
MNYGKLPRPIELKILKASKKKDKTDLKKLVAQYTSSVFCATWMKDGKKEEVVYLSDLSISKFKSQLKQEETSGKDGRSIVSVRTISK